LISDVNNYHLFVPWCVSSRVLSRKTITIPGPPSTLTSKATAPPITKTLMRAELGVGFQAANENYISDVICVHSSKIQAVASNSAVFKTLTTTWSLTPQAGPKPTPAAAKPAPASDLVSSDLPYCMVDFSIAFEFRSALYSGLAQLFMTEVSQQMVRAFEERARAVYGGGGNRSFGLDRRS
ncbi:cyclase/dehydrase, partial [Zopfochytrium polystomum]